MSDSRTHIGPLRSTGLGALLFGGILVLGSMPVLAEARQPTVEQLQKEIRKRDALIDNLAHRVDQLERKMKQGMASAKPAAKRQPAAPAAVSEAPAEATPASSPTEAAAPAAAPAREQQASSASPAPGTFKVNVEAAQRALERTLTASGALLVPYGSVDLEPSVSYTRRETPNLVLFSNNRNEYNASANIRIGLPWESQLTLGVPWLGVQQQVVDNFVSPVQRVSNGSGSSFGDFTIGWSKTLLHQNGGWRPDLIAGISYEAPTGPLSTNGIALTNSGQSKLGFSLTALKRQDPLAFVVGLGYVKAFEHDDLNPGNQVSVLTGAYLATSPQTTVNAVLQQSFVQAPTLHGVTVAGANSVQSILFLGASSILGRGVLLNLQAGIGLTSAAPKYTVILSLPYRFSW